MEPKEQTATLIAAMTVANTLCLTFAAHPVAAVYVVAVIGLVVVGNWLARRRS